MVVPADESLGCVNWHRQSVGPVAYYWAIGIAMLPQVRGHGYGTDAHRLLPRYLFAHTTAHRIEAVTDVDNTAERRALEKTGFTQEGVNRGIAWRNGAWRDTVTYGLLRTDERR
jgi:RimJ/RimL family protein N-acetyltransferase